MNIYISTKIDVFTNFIQMYYKLIEYFVFVYRILKRFSTNRFTNKFLFLKFGKETHDYIFIFL